MSGTVGWVATSRRISRTPLFFLIALILVAALPECPGPHLMQAGETAPVTITAAAATDHHSAEACHDDDIGTGTPLRLHVAAVHAHPLDDHGFGIAPAGHGLDRSQTMRVDGWSRTVSRSGWALLLLLSVARN